MHDVVYDIQKLQPEERKDLVKYIRYLSHND